MNHHQTDSVSRSIVISGSPDRVYRALTEEFGTWFQVRLDGPFRLGDLTSGAMTMPQVAGLPFKARTVALEPPRRFAFDWPQWDFEANRNLFDKPDGKLILVTAISPTPAGEGKTTTTVGLGDALNRIGRHAGNAKKAIICLREPSLGPVFAMKGGSTSV